MTVSRDGYTPGSVGGGEAAAGTPDKQPSGSPPPPAPPWSTPGHPGQCPACGSPHVQFTWKPDQQPTSERARCHHCGWAETRRPVPRGLMAGDPVTVHLASCHDPDQHQRVTVTGRVVEVYPDGAALAEMDDGSRFELCPWFTSDCANAQAARLQGAA